MAKTNITFGGITRNTGILSSKQGDCTELIGARIKDGSIVPAANRQIVGSIDRDIRKMIWHPAANKWICITAQGGISILNENYTIYDTSIDQKLSQLQASDIGIIGNSVTISSQTGMKYMLWKNKAYKWLGELPTIEDINISISVKQEKYIEHYDEKIFNLDDKWDADYVIGPITAPIIMARTDTGLNTARYNIDPSGDKSVYYNAITDFDKKISGYLSKAYSGIHGNRAYVDAAAFRIALRLFDDSFICISPLITLYCPESFKFNETITDAVYKIPCGRGSSNFSVFFDEKSELLVLALGFIPVFTLENIDLSDWKDIITSIEIFSSGSIPFVGLSRKERATQAETEYEYWKPAIPIYDTWGINIDNLANIYKYVGEGKGDYNPHYNAYGIIDYFEKTEDKKGTWVYEEQKSGYDMPKSFKYDLMYTEEYRKKFDDINSLHLCAKFDLKGNKIWEIENTHIDELALQDTLVIGSGVSDRIGGNIHVYNQRIHIWGEKEKFPDIIYYKNSFTTQIQLANTATIHAYVFLSIGGEIIIKKYGGILIPISGFIDGILNYPDSRAYKMVIRLLSFLTPEGSTQYDLIREFDLQPDNISNYAFHRTTPEELSPFPLESSGVYNNMRHLVKMNGWEEYEDRREYWNNLLVERDDYTPIGNSIRVSNAANPFYFGGKNEIAIGQEPVIGLMANVVTLSQGQFGEQPLYVFTGDGIYALSVDTSGQIAYTRATPVSLDTCSNARSIAAAGRGVVYATPGSLRYIEGDQTITISDEIQGKPGHEILNSPTLLQLAAATGLTDIAHEQTPFEEYLPEAIAVHNTQENEIIITNPSQPYSYIYSIISRTWHKIPLSWSAVAQRPAWCLLLRHTTDTNGTTQTQFWKFDPSNPTTQPFILVTRPQALGTTAYKHALQLAIRGWIDPDGNRTGTYLLGSNDALHFQLASAAETSRMLRDITLPQFLTRAYRYIIIAAGGTAGTQTQIEAAEIDATTTFESKL